MILMRDYYDP